MPQGSPHQLGATCLQLCQEVALLEETESIHLQGILNTVVQML